MSIKKMIRNFWRRHVVAPFPETYDPKCFDCNDDGNGCRTCQFNKIQINNN